MQQPTEQKRGLFLQGLGCRPNWSCLAGRKNKNDENIESGKAAQSLVPFGTWNYILFSDHYRSRSSIIL